MLPTISSIDTAASSEGASAAKVTFTSFWNLVENFPSVRGFTRSTASAGVEAKVWVVYGVDEPTRYPVAVIVQATAIETAPCLSAA